MTTAQVSEKLIAKHKKYKENRPISKFLSDANSFFPNLILNSGGVNKNIVLPARQKISDVSTDMKHGFDAGLETILKGENANIPPAPAYKKIGSNQKTGLQHPQKPKVIKPAVKSNPILPSNSKNNLPNNIRKVVGEDGRVSYEMSNNARKQVKSKSGYGVSVLPSMPKAAYKPPEAPSLQIYNPAAPANHTDNKQLQNAIKNQTSILNSTPRGVSDLLQMKYATKTLEQLQNNDLAQQAISQQTQAMTQKSVDSANKQAMEGFALQLDDRAKNEVLGLDERRLELNSRPKQITPKLPEFNFIKDDEGGIFAGNKQTGELKKLDTPSDVEKLNLIKIISGEIKADGKGNAISPEMIVKLKNEGAKKYGANFWN